jgi:predicted nucleotidyltransferase
MPQSFHDNDAGPVADRPRGYIPFVDRLADTSVAEDERLVVERLVELLRERLGGRLRSVWLYGSRARGERPGPDSDIDLLVIADPDDTADDVLTGILLVDRAAEELGLQRPIVSIKVHDPRWLEGRRAIDSFFIRDVDRDKVVLYGEP